MVQIINAYADGNHSVADGLRSLGESMFGDQAKNELTRQGAIKGRRQNEAAEAGAQAYRNNNQIEQNAQALRYDPTFTGMGAVNLAREALVPGRRADSPELSVRAIGAGHSAESTFPGLAQTLKQRADAMHEATVRQAQSNEAIAARQREADERKVNNTLIPTLGPSGPEQITQAEALARRGRGETVRANPLTPSQVVADDMWSRTHPAPEPTAPVFARPEQPDPMTPMPFGRGVSRVVPAAPRPEPGTPPASPFTDMPIDYRHAAGLPTGNQMFLNPATRETYLSQDGGQTVVTPSGKRVAVSGSNFVPVSNGEAVTQMHDNNAMTKAGEPLPPRPTAFSQAQNDAYVTSGPGSAVQHDFNLALGLINAGEHDPNVNRARENLTLLSNDTRALLAAPEAGRAALQDRKWINDTLPQPGFMGVTRLNRETAREQVSTMTQHLRGIYATVQQEAMDPNVDPKQRNALISYMRRLRQVIGQWEAPTAPERGAAPAGVAPAPAAEAPAPAAPRSKVVGGVTYTQDEHGNWFH